MATISEWHLDRLREAGLLVSEPFHPNHAVFPGGVIVGKPASVAGHSLPGYQARWGLTDVTLDAPSLWFHCDGGKWFVTSHDYIPGPGPGDFVHEWETPEEGVADIFDFYFGGPARMEVKRRARADLSWRVASAGDRTD